MTRICTERCKFWGKIVGAVAVALGFAFWGRAFDRYSDLITFLSILIGFKLTFASMLFGSPLARLLYDKSSPKYTTELHHLARILKNSLLFEFFSILVLFLIPDAYPIWGVTVGRYILVGPILFITTWSFLEICNFFFHVFTYPFNP